MVQDLIVAQAQKTKCNNHCFDNRQNKKYEIFFFLGQKIKHFDGNSKAMILLNYHQQMDSMQYVNVISFCVTRNIS